MRARRAIVAALLSGVVLAAGPGALGETLADVVAFAYAASPDALAERAQVRVLDEDYVQARAALGPVLQISGGVGYTYNRLDTVFGTLSETEGNASDSAAGLVQPLFTSGRAAASVDRAFADVEAGREALRGVETEVLQTIVAAYVGVLHDQRAAAAARENRDLLSKQLADTIARYDAREATATDRAQAEARFSASLADLALAEGRLDVSRSTFLATVGRNPGELAPEPLLPQMPASLREALAEAERRNPALAAARFREDAARADRSAVFAETLPQISLRVDASDLPATPFSNDRRDTDLSARLVFSQTLFNAGATSSRQRQTQARSDAARARTDAARRQMIEGVGQAWSQTLALRTMVARNTERVGSLRIALDGAREEERQGQRTTLDVLNQAQELQAAQLALIRSQADLFIAQVALLAQMGVLEPGLLSPGVETYDPKRAFDRVKSRGDTPLTPVLLYFDRRVRRDYPIPPSTDPAFGGAPRLEATVGPGE